MRIFSSRFAFPHSIGLTVASLAPFILHGASQAQDSAPVEYESPLSIAAVNPPPLTPTAAAAPRNDVVAEPPAGSGPVEIVGNGFRRVHRTETRTLSPQQAQQFRADGKGGSLQGNQYTFDTFTDYLPQNWNNNQQPDARVDSYGNPIVNITPGVPDWAQRDVDALRDAIIDSLTHLDNLQMALDGRAAEIAFIPQGLNAGTYQRGVEDLQTDLFESRHLLGNYLGQALTRHINVNDIIGIEDQALTDETIDSVASYLNFYEGLKMHEAALWRQPFVASTYAADVTARLAGAGHEMSQVLTPEPRGEVGDEGGTAGIILFCNPYSTFSFGVGMTSITGATVLWTGSTGTYDDVSADISIGFRHYFYPCQDDDQNTMLRVSTNGYATFFQQGGGALDGTDWTNDPLPDANDPDGFIAPWWDDLTVINQGGTDSVSYKVEGSVGNRVLTVQYSSISRRDGNTNDFHWFQLKVMEGYTQVQCHYDTLWLADSIDDATTGIENYNGSQARCAFSCSNLVSLPPDNNFDFFHFQASNDNCGSAICIEEDQIISSNNFGSSGTDLSSCSFNDFADVWYRYTASANGTVNVSLCETIDMDTTVSVFSACGGAELACSDLFCGLQSETTFAAVAGNSYLIRVAGYNSTRGYFRIRISGGGSLGDVCSNCHTIAGPTFSGFTTNNSGCNDDTSCAFSDTVDEWFCWTAPLSGTARAHTCSPTTDFDTTLAAFSGACTFPSQLACNDDASAQACELAGNPRKSRIGWNVQAGAQYKIRLSGFAGDTGNYLLTVGMHPCPADISPAFDGNNVVNVSDLLAVITAWGPCPGYCREDFMPPGGDHQVNVTDLLGVITAWGTCP